ncbi:Uncharacterized protein Fot_19276 [Forsythia ovata]|uniref:Uncharacterized protein n=1 Tax=Forsythia ovata TaxID=205694 RepID=A0ABD1VKJ9_9LAMI
MSKVDDLIRHWLIHQSVGFRLGPLRFPAATANWDVAENTAFSPVSPAALAEVARVRNVVIIVVTELGVRRITPWALQNLVVHVVLQPQPLVPTTPKKPVPSSSTFIISRDGSKQSEQSSDGESCKLSSLDHSDGADSTTSPSSVASPNTKFWLG